MSWNVTQSVTSAVTVHTDSGNGSDDLDDALMKQLLSGDTETNFEKLADDILHPVTQSHDPTSGSGHGHGHTATVQEGLDLVDALDTLVQQIQAESCHESSTIIDNQTSVSLALSDTLTPFDLIQMEHNYCKIIFNNDSINVMPLKDDMTLPKVTNTVMTLHDTGNSFTSVSSPLPSSPLPSPARRSQRQIERIEKTVLEKIKAENAEMLKKERESLIGNAQETIQESNITVQKTPKLSTQKFDLSEDDDDGDDEELVIDFDNKKNKKGKKRMKKVKSNDKKMSIDSSDSSQNKTISMPLTQPMAESSELDDVIAALSGDTVPNDESTGTSSSRSQRMRRKPKRWDDDEVEVDFSGQLGILAEQNSDKAKAKVEKVKSPITKKNVSDANDDGGDDDDDDDDEDSEFNSEDDPDKLWCICRQPHDDRFMIGCDSCEEWFHGSCVNVTKLQGRQMEKAGKEWMCPSCINGITEGKTRDDLKKTADDKRIKLETEEKLKKDKLREEKRLEKELKKDNNNKIKEIIPQKDNNNNKGDDTIKSKRIPKIDLKHKLRNVPKKLQMPQKKRESMDEEREKLKALIKTSKKKLMNKSRREKTPQQIPEKSKAEDDFISKVVPIVRKPEVRKKHKEAIDPSVQDLFKAEPIGIRRSPSGSSATPGTTPSTPTTPGIMSPFSRKLSSSQDNRRLSQSSSSIIERSCASGCSKLVRCETNSSSVYCNNECIERHVKDSIVLWKKAKQMKELSGKISRDRDLENRVIVVEKSSGRLLANKDGIPVNNVLEFIKQNPSYEIFKTKSFPEKKVEDSSKLKGTPLKGPIVKRSASDDKRRISTSSDGKDTKSGGGSGSFVPDSIRLNVRQMLRDTLNARCHDADDILLHSDEIKKITLRIEEELYKLFNRDTGNKYRTKYRSLLFNLRDSKNGGLFRKVLTGKISPEKLVRMSAEELASSELAKWREREKNTMLEMIKRDAADKVQHVIVKKTHKGEELIETSVANETPNDEIGKSAGDAKPIITSQTSSSIINDLMGDPSVDTTAQHRTHLFSNNCRLCTKQTLPEESTKSESKDPKRVQSSSSSSLSAGTSNATRDEMSRPAPKRVRVELDTANKILEEAAKLSSHTSKVPNLVEDEPETEDAPSSTVCLSSPEAPSSSSASRSIWKGTVFMQDVAKFGANAVKVSGTVAEFMSQDLHEQITVCGRIAPEQVLDYVKKLKYSSRTDIAVVKFMTNKDDRIGYDAFFNYLNTRGRYGVVGNTGKTLKDFYILPLPKNGDVPDVLLPFDGPGLDRKSLRPNLLLGILVRSKKPNAQTPSSSSSSSSSATTASVSITRNKPLTTDRSYTPPPKINDSPINNDGSFTPPRKTVKPKKPDDDEPYDPEEVELSNSNSNSFPSSSSSASIHELMDQIAKSSNPVEMTSSVLATIASSSNVQLQRRLLDQLTAKVEEQKRQLEEQKKRAEEQCVASKASTSAAAVPNATLIPGLDGQFGSLSDVQIPDNLQEILTTVRLKTQEIEQQQQRLKEVAAAGFRFIDPIVKNFGNERPSEDFDESMDNESASREEPMEIDDDNGTAKSAIIEVNPQVETSTRVSDPRLRSKKLTQQLPDETRTAEESSGGGSHVAVSNMSAEELIKKAQQQIAALAVMEQHKKPNNKIKIEWKKKTRANH